MNLFMLAALAGLITWNNPLVSRRADPQITLQNDGYYYLAATVPEYDRIELRRAATLAELSTATPKLIWRNHVAGPASGHVRGPQLHFIDGKWYVYFAAAEIEAPARSRLYVLENASDNPFEGPWTEKGQIQLAPDSYSVDPTTFVQRGVRYLAWAQLVPDRTAVAVYLAKMDTPWSVASAPTLLARPDSDWEHRYAAIDEAPAFLARHGRVFITYSCGLPDAHYCLGMLTAAADSDLLEPKSWTKSAQPVFASSAAASQYGPGHNSFTTTVDGKTDILVYHARNFEKFDGIAEKNPERAVRAQPFGWQPDGAPDFGVPVADGAVH